MNLMTESNGRVVSCVGEDRISNLPEHLIDSILERIPVQDTVRTSIISKSWRYRWTKLKAVVFDKHFSNKFAKNGAFGRNGFVRIINQVLFLHKGPILKFHLNIPNMVLDSFLEVDQWMSFLSRQGVTELVLTNLNQRYELPSYLFCFLELRKLELQNCFYKPLEFEGFLNLEELFLKDIDFGASLSGAKVNLPQLKKLSLYWCINVYNFNIKATKLQYLEVLTCPDAMLIQLLDSPCLFEVVIILQNRIQDYEQAEKTNLATIFSNLPTVRTFGIDSYFVKFLAAEKIPKLLPHPICSLKCLWLLFFQLGDLDLLHAALCLLRNSPNLESLHMYMQDMQDPRVDVGPASNHLESPNCLDCTLDQLQTVEITYLEGSKPELLFIKLLLAHSPSLEKLTITASGDLDAKKILAISKDVMRFPRASPKAEVVYLNSEA
ncbi:F-box/FBD/LRR-repeat protein At1g13570 [Lactuca sativa]|uniref:F-box/FBD/LRR-repeat protein At1g13570 n=1 Tax=Lactuca sativa TaxID=4236 RepID=UPI000CD97B47|nr:F-box/FBD/LRR-repeat protein At1g13570 [Lactuca sativa]